MVDVAWPALPKAVSEATGGAKADAARRANAAGYLARFEAASLRSTPYAYAVDITGERTLGLIEADPFAASAPDPVMNDSDWLRLQAICGS